MTCSTGRPAVPSWTITAAMILTRPVTAAYPSPISANSSKPSTTITELDEDSSYSVQVRAKNDEGTSAWSRVATVKTNKGENVPPVFNDRKRRRAERA